MRGLRKEGRSLFSRIGKRISGFTGAAVLAAGLALAPASVNSRPAPPVTVNVKGTKVKQVKLNSTLAELDKKSKPYRKGTGKAVVPKLNLDAAVTLTNRKKELVLKHPNPVPNGAALTKKVNLTSFAKLVKKSSGKDMKKVKLYVDVSGNNANIYILPQDIGGKTLGKHQSGNLAVKLSYSRVPRLCAEGWGKRNCKNAPRFKAIVKAEVVLLKQPATTTRCKAWDVKCLKQQGKSGPGPGSGGKPGK